MAEVVKMPKMSDTMTEGVLAKWHKKVGDKVKSGDVLAEVETDKATMDFESYQDGTLLFIGVEEGAAVPVDAVIAVIGKEGEDYKTALADSGSEPAAKKEEKAAEPAPVADKKPVATAAPKVDLSSIPATVIRMPLLSDTMTEGTIEKWNFKVGDKVKADDSLADVATDKATMEVVGYEAGTLLYIGVKEGESVPVNGIIAIVGKEGTDITPLLQDAGSESAAPAAEQAAPEAKTETADAAPSASSSADDSRVKASPLARKIAKDKGINLNDVKGSAEGGRIIKKDVEEYTPAAKPAAEPTPAAAPASAPAAPAKAPVVLPTYTGEEKFTERAVTQMRKAISRRLSESLFTAPHFYVTMSIDMDQAIAARTRINDVAPVKISFNDFVLKACAVALKQHPAINSSFLGDKIRTNEHIHIGVAVAVDEGLLVPVIKFADGKSLSHISVEVKDFAGKAKSKKLQPAEMEGSTFTISNLGMFGVDEFTAIINTPNACILAVSGIQAVPVVKNGAVVPGNIMKVTLSADHRVVDGATAAAFLQTLKSLLEEPVRLLI
ncbi:pyruvate dehydrogenase complex dihydrolipoamide acetyltransferase [Mucilaginibacter sp. OK283]|jgi:pyruvate dehydrogenase E2 component (dihydrolipoamide acetyltransferase)|uniref:pyruvate dehydrogenase complex dihydrolipoamide acetyltransferase n=1 Tax=Mucilaginibacter sp. OK283 TaxID=1881049 RepID=UPI0008CD28C4|nr:pyruvate dehydrogenase complex dihydrolipoamide acetyltransferase [Mucilaginibacter sp. OK283]SEP35305.1 pyruvate dehydrogenase E2 component (dihydrolipoamide acetyltransferase) [Mucilaginibacter sp. OK283]